MIYHRGTDDLDGLQEAVKMAAAALADHRNDFDSIVVTGMSGVVVGVPVGLALGCPVVILRKAGDHSHASDPLINRKWLGERACFLDDFVSSGNTRERVRTAIREHGAHLAAEYTYRDFRYRNLDQDMAEYRERSEAFVASRKEGMTKIMTTAIVQEPTYPDGMLSPLSQRLSTDYRRAMLEVDPALPYGSEISPWGEGAGRCRTRYEFLTAQGDLIGTSAKLVLPMEEYVRVYAGVDVGVVTKEGGA